MRGKRYKFQSTKATRATDPPSFMAARFGGKCVSCETPFAENAAIAYYAHIKRALCSRCAEAVRQALEA